MRMFNHRYNYYNVCIFISMAFVCIFRLKRHLLSKILWSAGSHKLYIPVAEVMMFSCLAWHFLVCDIYITEEALAHELLIILFPINTILVLIILSHLNKLFLTRCSWPNMKLVHLDACVRITI